MSRKEEGMENTFDDTAVLFLLMQDTEFVGPPAPPKVRELYITCGVDHGSVALRALEQVMLLEERNHFGSHLVLTTADRPRVSVGEQEILLSADEASSIVRLIVDMFHVVPPVMHSVSQENMEAKQSPLASRHDPYAQRNKTYMRKYAERASGRKNGRR